MDERNEEHGREGGGWNVFRFVWVFGVVILIYVLSIGPVMKVNHVTCLNSRAVCVMYEPLWVAGRHVPPLGGFLHWYVYQACGVFMPIDFGVSD